MGSAFGSGLAQGLGQSIQKQQELRMNKEYRDALIAQTKAQTKLMEAQEQIKNLDMAMKGGAMQYAGIPGGEQVLAQAMQGMQNPQNQIATAPAPNKPTGLFGLIGRALNIQPQQQQPSPQNPMPTPPGAIAPPPIPKQGLGPAPAPSPTMQGSFYDPRDIAGNILWGMKSPIFTEHNLKSGDIARTADTGTHILLLNPQGKAIGAIQKAPEYSQGPEITTSTGAKITGPLFNKYQGYVGGPSIQTQPGTQEIPQKPSTEQLKDIDEIKSDLQQVDKLIQFAQTPENAKSFDYWRGLAYQINQNPSAQAEMARKGIKYLNDFGLAQGLQPPSGDEAQFFQGMANLEDIYRKKYFGTGRGMSNNIKEAMQKSVPQAVTQTQALALLQQTRDTLASDLANREQSISQPWQQRPLGPGVGSPGGVPAGYSYGGTKNGKPFYINPSAPP